MTLYVAPIVEGETEEGCVKKLLQRVWGELLLSTQPIAVLTPTRGHRDTLVASDKGDLANKLEQAQAKLAQHLKREPSSRGLILLLIDAESDCPRELAPKLLVRAQQTMPTMDLACVLPKRMLENWFVAAASSLAGKNGLPADLESPEKPEECSGSSWINRQMRKVNPGRKYAKTVDAKAFVSLMDLGQCRDRSDSFDKFCRELKLRVVASTEEPPK